MLSLVAGPVDIVPLDPLESVVLVSSAAAANALWVDGQGLYVFADTGSTHVGNLYLVQLDGHAVRVGHTNRSEIAWCAVDNLIAISGATGAWAKLRLPSSHLVSDVLGTHGVGHAVMPDRRLEYVGTVVRAYPYDSSSSTTEATIASHPTIVGTVGMAYAGKLNGIERWWCFDRGTNGTILRYDATNHLEDTSAPRTTLGAAVRALGYSVAHDLFIAVRRDTGRTVDQLYVYANEPVADSVSAPAFSPAARRGGRSVATVRVLGAQNEPCAGRNVTFAATIGTVDPATVATDSAGYARTSFYGPTDGPATGAELTATLEE